VAAVSADACTILVVDDDADVLTIYQRLFSAAGYRVACAANATDALRRLRVERPAAVVLDLAMPGVSGLAAARAIRNEPGGQAIPIVAVSALGESAAADALAAGCTEYYVKPIEPRTLLRVVERLLASARAAMERGHV
jgi:CheY-like chemotaxis protein